MNRSQLNAAVKRAFSAFGSLAVEATLEKENATGFDFSTNEVVGDFSTATVEVIHLETRHNSDSSVTLHYIAKTDDFDANVNYTSLVIDNNRLYIEKATVYEGVTLLELKE